MTAPIGLGSAFACSACGCSSRGFGRSSGSSLDTTVGSKSRHTPDMRTSTPSSNSAWGSFCSWERNSLCAFLTMLSVGPTHPRSAGTTMPEEAGEKRQNLVEIYRAENATAAQLLKSALNDAGIAASVSGESFSSLEVPALGGHLLASWSPPRTPECAIAVIRELESARDKTAS